MYSIKFSKTGYEVNSAVSGEEALSKIKDGYVPDIILLDIVMPGMDGFEILDNLKKNNIAPNALIIMLTNQGQLADIEKASRRNFSESADKIAAVAREIGAKDAAKIKATANAREVLFSNKRN